MTITTIIEKCPNGSYDVRTDDNHKGIDFMLLGNGTSVNDAIEDFLICHDDMNTLYKDEGRAFPNLTFEYIYDLPSFLNYYSKILSFAALERLTGVNQSQLSQYVSGFRKPSQKTAKKIETKLHEFAKELNQVQFV